jgi:hypothetical protein
VGHGERPRHQSNLPVPGIPTIKLLQDIRIGVSFGTLFESKVYNPWRVVDLAASVHVCCAVMKTQHAANQIKLQQHSGVCRCFDQMRQHGKLTLFCSDKEYNIVSCIDLYTYEYKFDGIYFESKSGYKLINEGF